MISIPSSKGLKVGSVKQPQTTLICLRKEFKMLKKALQDSGKTCKVTFVLPADVNALSACLCGDFNAWDAAHHPMKKQKDGSFKVTITLDVGCQYQFRYLTDNSRWENDYEADAYIPNPYGSENSVLNLVSTT